MVVIVPTWKSKWRSLTATHVSFGPSSPASVSADSFVPWMQCPHLPRIGTRTSWPGRLRFVERSSGLAPSWFADFLPGLDAEERRLCRSYMLQACERAADVGDAQCTSSTCKCNDRPWDKKYTEHGLDVCKGCRATGKKRHADCNKKWGK